MQQPAALAADFYYGTEDDEDELDDTSSHRPVRPKSRTSKTPAKAATTTTATATATATNAYDDDRYDASFWKQQVKNALQQQHHTDVYASDTSGYESACDAASDVSEFDVQEMQQYLASELPPAATVSSAKSAVHTSNSRATHKTSSTTKTITTSSSKRATSTTNGSSRNTKPKATATATSTTSNSSKPSFAKYFATSSSYASGYSSTSSGDEYSSSSSCSSARSGKNGTTPRSLTVPMSPKLRTARYTNAYEP